MCLDFEGADLKGCMEAVTYQSDKTVPSVSFNPLGCSDLSCQYVKTPLLLLLLECLGAHFETQHLSQS